MQISLAIRTSAMVFALVLKAYVQSEQIAIQEQIMWQRKVCHSACMCTPVLISYAVLQDSVEGAVEHRGHIPVEGQSAWQWHEVAHLGGGL